MPRGGSIRRAAHAIAMVLCGEELAPLLERSRELGHLLAEGGASAPERAIAGGESRDVADEAQESLRAFDQLEIRRDETLRFRVAQELCVEESAVADRDVGDGVNRVAETPQAQIEFVRRTIHPVRLRGAEAEEFLHRSGQPQRD